MKSLLIETGIAILTLALIFGALYLWFLGCIYIVEPLAIRSTRRSARKRKEKAEKKAGNK